MSYQDCFAMTYNGIQIAWVSGLEYSEIVQSYPETLHFYNKNAFEGNIDTLLDILQVDFM